MKCALLTSDEICNLIAEDRPLINELAKIGVKAEPVVWDLPNVDWGVYNFVLMRTPWDYTKKIVKFLNTMATIEKSGCRLLNSYSTIKWNYNKKYLLELQSKGAHIVPTLLTDRPTKVEWINMVSDMGWSEFVIKPTISANAYNTFRISMERLDLLDKFIGHAKDCDEWLIQPFANSVITEGEYSFMFFGGKFSFAVIKQPRAGDFRVQSDYGGNVQRIKPAEADLIRAQEVIEAYGAKLPYARVDMVRLPDGHLSLIELELIEPQLFFEFYPESIHQFIGSIGEFI